MTAHSSPALPPFSVCMMNGVFDEVAESLRHGLATLGHPVEVLTGAFLSDSRTILLGAQLVADWNAIPTNTVLFNFEQLGAPSHYITDAYLHQLSRHTVWDYSPRNIAWLAERGINQNVRLVRIGHSPALVRVPRVDQDIDVLFYGAVNERRYRVLEAAKDAGLRVVLVTNMFGAERDLVIGRAKVVLNMHYYDTKIFEIARVGFLLANGKAVVTEAGPDTELEDALRPAMAAVPYEQLAETCRQLVADSERRQCLERAAQEIFAARSQADFLRSALEDFMPL